METAWQSSLCFAGFSEGVADIVKALGWVLDKLDTLAEQNAQIIGLLTDIKTNTTK